MALLYKKNKLQFLTIVCLIFLIVNGTAASVSVGPVPPVFSTLYVDSGGSGNYTTIQAAVNNANPGDTIIVYPGTYTEVVDINVANLTIRSLSGNPEDTIVRTLSPSHNFKVIANDVTISGFNITGEGYYTGVFILGVSGVNITNNKFSGNDCAIQMQSSRGCNLINNTVSGSTSYGFHLLSSSNCILANNTISNTDEEGIYLDYSPNSHLSGNTVSNSGYDGICLYYSGSCNLTGNVVSDSSDDGIYLYYSSSCNLTDNEVSNIDDDGIYLYEAGSSILTNNTVSDSYYGISLGYSDECVLRNNTASSGIYGICLWDIQNCTLTGNIMSGNWYNFDLDIHDIYDLDNATGNIIDTSNLVDGKAVYYLEGEPNPSIGSDAGIIYGINCGNTEIKDLVLQNNSYAVFLYNTSSEMQNNTINNTAFGITVFSSQDVRLSDSRVENSWAGIVFEEDMNITLTDNTVRNSIYGIVTYDSENCTLTGNSVQDSMENYGLVASGNSRLVSSEENAPISENTFTNSNLVQSVMPRGIGIYSEYCQNLRLENNVIDQISDTGIYLGECQDAELVRNSVRDIGYTGIYTEYSSDVELLDNTVQNVAGEYLPLYDSGNPSLVSKSRDSGYGIYFYTTQNIRLVSNSVRDIGYMGICTEDSSSVEILDNTVQNVTGEYELRRSGNLPFVSSSLVSESPGISGYGICFDETQDFRLEGNTVEDSYQVWGIYLYEPVNATLGSNDIESCKIGLASYDGYNCSISDCSVTNCSSGGILIQNLQKGMGAEYTVTGCTVDGSEIGLLVTGESILSGNTLSGNSYGIVLYDVNNSVIYGNTMVENSLAGLALDLDQTEIWSRIGLVGSIESPESGNNTIYNNYFSNVNNTLIYSEANNTWNISKTSGESIVGGPYLGGNYWANPSGTGFSENCTDANKDGIADSSYEFVNGTFDYLPLTIIPPTTRHRSSANYIPSNGGSTDVTGYDSAQKRVAAGSETTFSFSNPVSDVLGLSFTSRHYSGNVIVRIELLEAGSGEIPEGEVYQLMNILVGNERFESEDNINGASINFRVSKSWVEENNIDVSTIKISRFHDEEWNALPTKMTYEDEEYYYFTAETPGFSRYAITDDKLGSVAITPAEEEETGAVTGDEQTGDVEKSTPGFEGAFALPGIFASVFFAKKRILK